MSKEKSETFSYEAARKRLEKIQTDLEAGKVGIDDLDTVLAEARELIQKSMDKLTQAEKSLKKWEP